MSDSTSVIIPCFNGEQFLGEALESIRCQTVRVKEIIITDDGSTRPLQPPQDWNGPPLKIIRTENRGLSSARNMALAAAKGEFVAFLDSDDMWEPNKIALQEDALRSNPSAVACYTRCLDRPGFFGFGPYPPMNVPRNDLFLVMWYTCFFPPSCVMVRRETLEKVGRFREDFLNGEDFELWLRLLSEGDFLQIPKELTWYRVHPNQFSTNVWKRVYGGKQARAAALKLHTQALADIGIEPAAHWAPYRNDILMVYYRRHLKAARPLLWDYWRDHPRDFKIFVYWLVTFLPEKWVRKVRGEIGRDSHSGESKPATTKTWDGYVYRLRSELTTLQNSKRL